MTPEEFFKKNPEGPQFIHGSDVGVDEEGGVWVRADARLRSDLMPRVCPLSERPAYLIAREYSILTSNKMTMLDPRDRSEPIWQHVHKLETGSIGEEWIAVG